MDEVPLYGGRTTKDVVLVDNTVRRKRTKRSDFVRQLLEHLKTAGFDGAPRYLGIDANDRDILSYIPGEVPPDLKYWKSEILVAAAQLIRRLHDSTAKSELISGHEVVCHNDLSPCNAVFVGGIPRALIDFDAAAPGTRSWDLGYAAWLWLNIGEPDISGRDQGQRLTLFLDSYGFEDRGSVLLAMKKRQIALERECEGARRKSTAEWARVCRYWLESHWDELGSRGDT